MSSALKVGDPAPEFRYLLPSGESKQLSGLWSQGPALVLWLRHFG